jgi:hypothetical protein
MVSHTSLLSLNTLRCHTALELPSGRMAENAREGSGSHADVRRATNIARSYSHVVWRACVGVSITEDMACRVCGMGARGESADPTSVRSSGREGAASMRMACAERRAKNIARRCMEVVW